MKICIIKDCKNRYRAKGYCRKHYLQLYNHGKILKRTAFDKNIFSNKHRYLEMTIYNRKQELVACCKVDRKDFKILCTYKWGLSGNGYVTTRLKNKIIYIHRLIMGTSDNNDTDHINGNKLDNRRKNLRVCSTGENCRNKTQQSNNISGYKGVYLDKSRNLWCAEIKVNYKKIHIGRFKTKLAAALAYNRAARKYHGKYAKLNSMVQLV